MEFSQANGFSQFILLFSAGATSQNFPNPTAIDQFRSVKERRRPDSSERKIYVRHCIVPAACRMLEAWMVTALRRPKDQKKKYFCFSNRLLLQSRSPRVGRVGRCVFTTTVFGTCFFGVEQGGNEEKQEKEDCE